MIVDIVPMPDPQLIIATQIAVVYERLRKLYGVPERKPCSDPVGQLVATILSQNTSDVNTERAYASLTQTFTTWSDVMTAPSVAVIEAVRSGGLAKQKSKYIQQTLRRIYQARGDFDLSWLATLPVGEARKWLTSLPGVGNKTASIVLLFCFGRPAFPVDTHVHRVTRRLGLAPASASPDQVMRVMEEYTPPAWFHALHLNLIRHGREICKARSPQCQSCILSDICDCYQSLQKEGTNQTKTPSRC